MCSVSGGCVVYLRLTHASIWHILTRMIVSLLWIKTGLPDLPALSTKVLVGYTQNSLLRSGVLAQKFRELPLE